MNSLNTLYNPTPPTNGVLYHYTDFAGLKGILESHTLWATYNRVMNDASEQVYAESLLSEEIDRLLAGSEIRKFIPFNPAKCFLTCFCETENLLSMWRGYAGAGGGYCLGFDYASLKSYMCWPAPKIGKSMPLVTRCPLRQYPRGRPQVPNRLM